MDKKEFIDYGPVYYALAIAAFTRQRPQPFTVFDVVAENTYPVPDTYPEESDNYLRHELLVSAAINWLVEKDFLTVIPDRFGDPIYGQSPNFREVWEQCAQDGDLPFQKFMSVKAGWLQGALLRINTEFDRLKITEADFKNPDLEWEPLPLDRDNPALKEVTKNLEKLIEEVRKDNGYAGTLPQERNLVLTELSEGLRTLKEENETSAAYLKEKIIANLKRVAVRFKDGTKHILSKAVINGLADYVKEKAAVLLHYIFSNLS